MHADVIWIIQADYDRDGESPAAPAANNESIQTSPPLTVNPVHREVYSSAVT